MERQRSPLAMATLDAVRRRELAKARLAMPRSMWPPLAKVSQRGGQAGAMAAQRGWRAETRLVTVAEPRPARRAEASVATAAEPGPARRAEPGQRGEARRARPAQRGTQSQADAATGAEARPATRGAWRPG
jgi:hypothetical protein